MVTGGGEGFLVSGTANLLGNSGSSPTARITTGVVPTASFATVVVVEQGSASFGQVTRGYIQALPSATVTASTAKVAQWFLQQASLYVSTANRIDITASSATVNIADGTSAAVSALFGGDKIDVTGTGHFVGLSTSATATMSGTDGYAVLGGDATGTFFGTALSAYAISPGANAQMTGPQMSCEARASGE